MRTYYQLQRSTPGHQAFRDWRDPWSSPAVAAAYAIAAVRGAVPGAVVRILPFEI